MIEVSFVVSIEMGAEKRADMSICRMYRRVSEGPGAVVMPLFHTNDSVGKSGPPSNGKTASDVEGDGAMKVNTCSPAVQPLQFL